MDDFESREEKGKTKGENRRLQTFFPLENKRKKLEGREQGWEGK